MSSKSRARALGPWFALLLAVLAAIVLGSICVGSTGTIAPAQVVKSLAHACGWGSGLDDPRLELIVELRSWRALTAAGVGAALALSGGLIQGLFRNGLASPSLLGVSGLWRDVWLEATGPAFISDLFMIPDIDRSLVTAVGLRQSGIWVHDFRGERQVSVEGYGSDPKFTRDGERLVYRILSGALTSDPGELRMLEV